METLEQRTGKPVNAWPSVRLTPAAHLALGKRAVRNDRSLTQEASHLLTTAEEPAWAGPSREEWLEFQAGMRELLELCAGLRGASVEVFSAELAEHGQEAESDA